MFHKPGPILRGFWYFVKAPQLGTTILKQHKGQKDAHISFLWPHTSSFGKSPSHPTKVVTVDRKAEFRATEGGLVHLHGGDRVRADLCPAGVYTRHSGAELQFDGCVSFPRGPGTQNVIF